VRVADIQTEIEIDRPRAEVAAYAADPDNARAWYANIKSVEWETQEPLAVGARIAFVATFLGRRMSYTYEVTEFEPSVRMTMRTTDGAVPMETIYTWQDTAAGGTRMALRNRGEPAGIHRVAFPAMARAMRSANRKDLARLKTILETGGRENVTPAPR
jgi:uncharacterized membrane protein